MNPFAFLKTSFGIAIAIALAVAFAALEWKVYHMGATSVRTQWDAAKAVQIEGQRLAEKAVRQIEIDRETVKEIAQNEAKIRETNLRTTVAAARADADSLRSAATAFARSAAEQPAAVYAERASTLAGLFNDVEAAGRAMAEKADRHASDAVACVQSWPK